MRVLVTFLALTLSACASVPMAPAAADAAAKQFQAPAGKARVYLIRASRVAPAILFKVSVDDRMVAMLPVNVYAVADVEPGQHTFAAAGNENEDSVTMEVEAGRAYFLRVGPRPGWLFARVAIYEIPEHEGQRVVGEASLATGY